MANNYHNPHEVVKGDPRVNGPYLDDILADQERAYRERRNKQESAPVAEVVVEDEVVVTEANAQPELPLDESVEDE